MPSDRDALAQRADYTHTYNTEFGRHGWLRLTPAYSVKIVEELLTAHDAHFSAPLRVFDPFCGSATTALCAGYHGHEATTTDINPFLVWFGQAKTANYTLDDIEATDNVLFDLLELVADSGLVPAALPAIHNIDRWWTPQVQEFLQRLRTAIDRVTPPESSVWTLLRVAFCRTLIKLSHAAFNHQSLSFADDPNLFEWKPYELGEAFEHDVRAVLRGAAENPRRTARVVSGDARQPGTAVSGPIDLVITSPPYANRMSYIRELRPYMYWLGYLTDGRAAGELDWEAIGGTWGIATSRLGEWERGDDRFTNDGLETLLNEIAVRGAKSGTTLARYVARYVDDMWGHFQALPPLLAREARVHYIVGNSTFYDVLLPIEALYGEMLERLGFADVSIRPIRKRNSKRALIEFDVSARWP